MLLQKTAIKLLDALNITLPRGQWHTGKRNFSALSFRFSGDSETHCAKSASARGRETYSSYRTGQNTMPCEKATRT